MFFVDTTQSSFRGGPPPRARCPPPTTTLPSASSPLGQESKHPPTHTMGSIKDREAKKKAAKVFSSGGGGGTKGPAVVDKRNQELTCPHCDRVFKQVRRGRGGGRQAKRMLANHQSDPLSTPL